MTHPRTAERRPTPAGGTPSQKLDPTATKPQKSAHSLPEPAHLLAGVYVVLFAHPDADRLRYRRRVYFSLPAAQRAAERAGRRGLPAAVVLCNLHPVHTFNGGWPA